MDVWMVVWTDFAQGPGTQVADFKTREEAARFAEELASTWSVGSIAVTSEETDDSEEVS